MAYLGIDVSSFQGNIDWNKVKSSGVKFVIIRAGYGKSTVDKYFKKNIEGALAAGLAVGAYWFVYAYNDDRLIQNANSFMSALAPYKDKLTMGVWCDWEYDSDDFCAKNNVSFTKEGRSAFIKKFCNILILNGYKCGVYLNPDYIKNKVTGMNAYPLWLAHYANKMGNYDALMWQYSSKGNVDGINGYVDMNQYFGVLGSASNPYPVPTRTLKRTFPTMTGEDVKWLQYELELEVDGKYGPATAEAVRYYQRSKGLEVDGKVGPATRNSLISK